MRPERESEESLDPCPGQMDCRYGAEPLRESEPAPENAVPDQRGAPQTCSGDDYASRRVARYARAIQCGWRQDHKQAYTPRISVPGTKVAHAAHEQGASRRVGLEIIGNHNGDPSPLLGTSYGSPHLLAKHIGRASRSDPPIEPAIAPVQQAKAVDLPILPRRFDQALPTSPLATPHARQRRVKGHLHLILEVEVRACFHFSPSYRITYPHTLPGSI